MKRLAITVAAGAMALGAFAAPATAAEAAPPCEIMLPPDVCEQFFYGPLGLVSGTTYWATRTAEDAVWDAATTADALYKSVWCKTPLAQPWSCP